MDSLQKQITDSLMKVIEDIEEGFSSEETADFIIETLQSAFDMNFQAKGRHDGSSEPSILSGGSEKWGELSELTKAAYKRRGINDSDVTLYRTGALQESIYVNRAGDSFIVGAGVPYARRQQLGFSGTVNVPAHKRTIKKKDGGTKSVQVKSYSYEVEQKPYPYLVISREDVIDIVDFVMGGNL